MNRMPLPPGMEKAMPSSNEKKQEPDERALEADVISFILDAELIPQHRLDPNIITFISKYLLCRHSRQAARETGLAPNDGPSLLRRPDIYRAIAKITDRSVMKHGYDASEVVERVKEISDVDPGDMQNPVTGAIVENLHLVPVEVRRAIKKFKAKNIYDTDPNGMKTVTGCIIEVEFWDKMRANELLGREKDLFVEKKKVEHGISADMRSVLLESKRLAETYIDAAVEREALPAPIDVTPVKEE